MRKLIGKIYYINTHDLIDDVYSKDILGNMDNFRIGRYIFSPIVSIKGYGICKLGFRPLKGVFCSQY